MRTLILMRHAKSDWGFPDLADFDRPLNKRGNRDAPAMGTLIGKSVGTPDLIIASAAKRTQETAGLIAKASGYGGSIESRHELYDSAVWDYEKVIQGISNDVHTAVLIGHNPTMERTLSHLCSGGADSTNIIMPTGATAVLELNVFGWKDVRKSAAFLKWFAIPKMIHPLSE